MQATKLRDRIPPYEDSSAGGRDSSRLQTSEHAQTKKSPSDNRRSGTFQSSNVFHSAKNLRHERTQVAREGADVGYHRVSGRQVRAERRLVGRQLVDVRRDRVVRRVVRGGGGDIRGNLVRRQ